MVGAGAAVVAGAVVVVGAGAAVTRAWVGGGVAGAGTVSEAGVSLLTGADIAAGEPMG